MRILTFVLSFVFIFQSMAIADSNTLLKLRNPNQSAVIRNYEILCEEEGVSAVGPTVKQMCEVVTKSELCSKVAKEDLLQCNTLDRNIVVSHAINQWDMLMGCAQGAFNSVVDTLKFFWDVMKWAWENTTSSEARGKTSGAVSQVANSAKLYLHTEYQKAYAKATPPMQEVKAISSMNAAFGKLIYQKIVGFLEEQAEEFGCLNEEAKTKRICKVAGDIFLPPTGALALIKYGSKGLKQLPKFASYFRKVEVLKFAKLAETYPELAIRLRRLNADTPPTATVIQGPEEIPFQLSNGFRPVADYQMIERAKELSPDMRAAVTGAYNALNSPVYLNTYMQDLFKETAEWMAKRGRPEDLEYLKQGFVSKHAINVVLVRRLKARGDTNFTTIKAKDGKFLSSGSTDLKGADVTNPNEAFRTAVKTGPFFDRAFDDTDRFGHGTFSHMMQRDIVHKSVSQATQGQPQKFYDFLGTKKGINFWGDLFDSGNERSFTRPETLSAYVAHSMTPSTSTGTLSTPLK